MRAALLLVWFVVFIAAVDAASVRGTDVDVLETSAVVSLEVEDVAMDHDVQQLSLRVVEVFAGDKSLVGSVVLVRQSADDRSRHIKDPIPAQGEQLLWIIRRRNGILGPVAPPGLLNCRPVLPARRGITPRYQECREWIDAVSRTTDSERRLSDTEILELVMSNTPEVSVWAVWYWYRTNESSALAGLRSMVNAKGIGVVTQLAIDSLLCEKLKMEWIGSAAQVQLLDGWLNSSLDDFSRGKALAYVTTSASSGRLQMVALKEALVRSIRRAEGTDTTIRTLSTLGATLSGPSSDGLAICLELLVISGDSSVQDYLAHCVAGALSHAKDKEVIGPKVALAKATLSKHGGELTGNAKSIIDGAIRRAEGK